VFEIFRLVLAVYFDLRDWVSIPGPLRQRQLCTFL